MAPGSSSMTTPRALDSEADRLPRGPGRACGVVTASPVVWIRTTRRCERRTSTSPGRAPPLLPRHLDPPRDRSNPQGQVTSAAEHSPTGTGKRQSVAFQICWRLWSTGWNRTGEYRKAEDAVTSRDRKRGSWDDPQGTRRFAPFGEGATQDRRGATFRKEQRDCTSRPTRRSPHDEGPARLVQGVSSGTFFELW